MPKNKPQTVKKPMTPFEKAMKDIDTLKQISREALENPTSPSAPPVKKKK